MSGATQTRPPRQHGPGGFEHTVKDFWASRPRRPVQGHKLAGVAAAIGRRYAIDPVIVRVGFAVATIFGGSGILLYLLGWLFLPQEGDEVSAAESLGGRGQASLSRGAVIALCVALIPAAGWTFDGGAFTGSGFIGLALAAAALFLLHRHRGQLNRPVPSVRSTGYRPVDPGAAAAPGWDPLAADPMAWDLPDPHRTPQPVPEPAAPPAPVSRFGARIGLITFATALLVAGGGAALSAGGVSWFSVQHVLGLVAAVLGAGMVAGALAGRPSGVTGLAIPVAIVGVLLTATPLGGIGLHGGVGEVNATPRSAAELQPEYQAAAGRIRLDLRQLPPGPPVRVNVRSGMGETQVNVPATADVEFDCQSGMGATKCLGRESSGIASSPVTGTDFGTDGPGGQRITLNVRSGMGKVEVQRG